MKAVVHEGKLGFDGLTLGEIEKPQRKAGEVRVKLKKAGLNLPWFVCSYSTQNRSIRGRTWEVTLELF